MLWSLSQRVNFHALKFLPEIDEMDDQLVLVARMRNRTGSSKSFLFGLSTVNRYKPAALYVVDEIDAAIERLDRGSLCQRPSIPFFITLLLKVTMSARKCCKMEKTARKGGKKVFGLNHHVLGRRSGSRAGSSY